MMRMGFNLHPAFRGTGGCVEHVAHDMSHIRIRLPLNWRTRNVVGSIYGGSLFAVTDGVHPMMLMSALGDGVIVSNATQFAGEGNLAAWRCANVPKGYKAAVEVRGGVVEAVVRGRGMAVFIR